MITVYFIVILSKASVLLLLTAKQCIIICMKIQQTKPIEGPVWIQKDFWYYL